MDILLLGLAAIVLIGLTVWIVWRPSRPDTSPGGAAVRGQEESDMLPPQGDAFEDQYTSATADLSAGGVAVTEAEEESAEISDYQRAGEPWSDPAHARETTPAAMPAPAPLPALPEPSGSQMPRTIGIGAAALLTAGGAAAGAWLYSRWQKQRNQPIERLRRKLR